MVEVLQGIKPIKFDELKRDLILNTTYEVATVLLFIFNVVHPAILQQRGF